MIVKKRNYIIFGCFILVLLTVFYYRMLNGDIPSDFRSHLHTSLAGSGYSFNNILFRTFYIFDNAIIIAILCAVITIATPIALYGMMKEIDLTCENKNYNYLILVSIMIIMASALVVPIFYDYFYYGQLAMNPWHNDTYTFMRLFSIIALVYYIRIQDMIIHNRTLNYFEYIKLSIFLFLSAWSKPSFVLGFFPVMIIYFIIDILKADSLKKTKQIILLGFTAIPGGLMVLWQNSIVYINDSSENYLTFGLSPAYLETGNPILKVVLFLIIPLIVLLYNRRHYFKKRIAQQLWILWAVQLFYYIFLFESGPRMMHGNFGWGSLVANFFLFAYSIFLFSKNFKDISAIKLTDWKTREFVYIVSVGSLFLYQVATGIIWFIWILTGHSYYC